jgi:hypothetical protein
MKYEGYLMIETKVMGVVGRLRLEIVISSKSPDRGQKLKIPIEII